MLNIKKSPHGFILPNLERFAKVEEGCELVNGLEKQFIGRLHTSWSIRKVVIELTRLHFAVATDGDRNGLRTFMTLQYLNGKDHFTPMHYQFLIDTIRFLRTGYRRVQPATCLDLIQGYLEGSVIDHGRVQRDLMQREEELKSLIQSITPEEDLNFIRIWVSHPTGLSDLMASLKLLFGGKKGETLPLV